MPPLPQTFSPFQVHFGDQLDALNAQTGNDTQPGTNNDSAHAPSLGNKAPQAGTRPSGSANPAGRTAAQAPPLSANALTQPVSMPGHADGKEENRTSGQLNQGLSEGGKSSWPTLSEISNSTLGILQDPVHAGHYVDPHTHPYIHLGTDFVGAAATQIVRPFNGLEHLDATLTSLDHYVENPLSRFIERAAENNERWLDAADQEREGDWGGHYANMVGHRAGDVLTSILGGKILSAGGQALARTRAIQLSHNALRKRGVNLDPVLSQPVKNAAKAGTMKALSGQPDEWKENFVKGAAQSLRNDMGRFTVTRTIHGFKKKKEKVRKDDSRRGQK
ncbi:hypothetical protein [Oecophyllibacter saccharovorans]|uniref:Uncharacterized protein n=1 Tax=Oecophyllibacter saccharovorans TaxID=2558360 RepID=A0A506UMP7_9PROT|nr:hypothetical protein [Oecophyllibacter saccharovorans]TPW34403.1 hypothetical protein E3202_07920 [Oecophyllibacter saccharovorans]